MNNVRGLYPPLYGAAPSGGGGGGGEHIQVDALPEASLEYKNKIVQYTGATTETLNNGYFYKCVEDTTYEWEETEASETYTEAETLPTASAETVGTIYKVDDTYYQTVIVLSYSWDAIPVMEVESVGGIVLSNTETVVGTYLGKPLYAITYDKTQINSFDLPAHTSSTSATIKDSGLPAIETLVNSILIIDDASGQSVYIGGLFYTNGVLMSTNIYSRFGSAAASMTDKTLTIFYTKTTD